MIPTPVFVMQTPAARFAKCRMTEFDAVFGLSDAKPERGFHFPGCRKRGGPPNNSALARMLLLLPAAASTVPSESNVAVMAPAADMEFVSHPLQFYKRSQLFIRANGPEIAQLADAELIKKWLCCSATAGT